MNRWLYRVYLTLSTLVVLLTFGCSKASLNPSGVPPGDTSRDTSIWHQRIQVVWPGAYGVPQHGYCMSDGEPAISYVDVANTDLYFTQSFDADGTSDGTLYAWDTPVLVDNAATSLAPRP